MSSERYARHIALFGAEGQRKLAQTFALVVGLGGLGAHVAQQLAYLGVQRYLLVDDDAVEESNLNRLIGAGPDDVGRAKVEVAMRGVRHVLPEAEVACAEQPFAAAAPPNGSGAASVIFGCVDGDAARAEILRHSAAHQIAYIDLASDVGEGGEFGGRVVFSKDGERCLSCLGELDQHELARAQMTDEQRAADDAIYGVDRAALADGGPSVVSVNGVVAALAVTEFMAWRTGLREPAGFLNYRGDLGTVGRRADDPERPWCHFCAQWGR